MSEPDSSTGLPRREKLEGWKAIAGHFDVVPRVAQRWEKELGLPVWREDRQQKAKVFAYSDELDAWRKQRQTMPREAERVAPRRYVWAAMGAAGAALVLLSTYWLMSRPGPAPAVMVRPGRLLVRSISEGRIPLRVAVTPGANVIAVTPRGDKVYAGVQGGRLLSVVSTTDFAVRTLSLPRDAMALAAGPDEKLYIGSAGDGLMVLDTREDRLLPEIIPTGGAVWDMALTPDGRKLYLAMSYKGVKRFSTKTRTLTQLTDRVCPEFVEMDRQGKNLYVSYQCGGPGGRRGHDSVEVFDVGKEVSTGIISGPPMVGGDPSVSPDGRLVMLWGGDACVTAEYDHAGCPSVPSRVYHLLRASDRQVLKTFGFPPGVNGPGRFIDGSRIMLQGRSLTVLDASNYMIRESLDLRLDHHTSFVAAPDGRRVYVATPKSEILVLELEGASCEPPDAGLALSYTGDGTMDDPAGTTVLERRGNVAFTPGKVGQAFFFGRDGGFLEAPWTSHFDFGLQDSTLALYVKFASLGAESCLIDRTQEEGHRGSRLVKTSDHRFRFDLATTGGTPVTVTSASAAREGAWYHLAMTRTDQTLTLYVNGQLEDSRPIGNRPYSRILMEGEQGMRLGALAGGRAPLHGWLDEVLCYYRALTAEEIKALYLLRETGPCKL
jgi:DNA-binding beta-propeller fold protein YncE